MSNLNLHQIRAYLCSSVLVQHGSQQDEVQIFISLLLQSSALLFSGCLKVKGMNKSNDGVKLRKFYEHLCLYFY